MPKRYAYTDDDRLDMYVWPNPVTGCWDWTGPVKDSDSRRGEIQLRRAEGRVKLHAYRWLYELLVEPVSAELVLDHLCRNPNCVNPDHLEPVTQKVNSRRGVRYLGEGPCRSGQHLMVGDNVVYKSDGRRQCRACLNAARRKAHQRSLRGQP